MSKEQARLLRFMLRYPCEWHSYAPSMRRTLYTLQGHLNGNLPVLEVTKTQFRLTPGGIKDEA